MTSSIAVDDVSFHVLPMQTRFPFQYGIASMTALPHLLVSVSCRVDGRQVSGLSSEGLPPKWFTKNPETTFEEDLPAMLEVIRHAAELVTAAGEKESYFDLWKELYEGQAVWANEAGHPPLLANLGVSLMERAVIDAMARASGSTFADMVRENAFGIRLGEVHPELGGSEPGAWLPEKPLESVVARHTVGLGDPLTEEDVDEPLNDGLPLALDECIASYGLRYFKLKVCGVLEKDLARLRRISEVLESHAAVDYRVTIDGNEQYGDIDAFRAHWEAYAADGTIARMLEHLILVEQPLHRDRALDGGVKEALASWAGAPPLIIDESEAELASLPRALELGYSGTSHKNCKGIVKGIVNACLLEKMRRDGRELFLSGEDLANVGPVALLQDLAVMASLGIEHV